jgi:hypothetical protein
MRLHLKTADDVEKAYDAVIQRRQGVTEALDHALVRPMVPSGVKWSERTSSAVHCSS